MRSNHPGPVADRSAPAPLHVQSNAAPHVLASLQSFTHTLRDTLPD